MTLPAPGPRALTDRISVGSVLIVSRAWCSESFVTALILLMTSGSLYYRNRHQLLFASTLNRKGVLTSKTASAPSDLQSSQLRCDATVTTLYPARCPSWIAYIPTDAAADIHA